MGTRDIHDQLQDLYGIEMSAEMVSKITDKILIRELPTYATTSSNPYFITVPAVCRLM